MKKSPVPFACLVLGTACLVTPAANGQQAQPIDVSTMHVQVILDRLGFAPGVIDGKQGQSLKAALRGFQTASGLKETGEADAATLKALSRWRQARPMRLIQLTAEDFRGPFNGRLPDDPAVQAKMPQLGYANALEALAERYHTTPHVIARMNPPGMRLAPGARIRVPDIAVTSRDYPAKLPEAWRATLVSLNVDARQPKAKRVVVDKSESVLKVYDADDKLVAQFPATMGSAHDPLPIGNWKIQGAAYNPTFHYNPDLFWDADSKDEKARLPAGPNSPVGVVWLDLNKPHYGIHGTPNPEKIGRTESHGCIRLANWDVARLALMIEPGTAARFQE